MTPHQLRELYTGAAAGGNGVGLGATGPTLPFSTAHLGPSQRLLDLSPNLSPLRYGMRPYDLAQQMLQQQGAVSKLLGKFLPQQ